LSPEAVAAKTVTRLVLVRHGQTALNREQRVQGLSDNGVDETGLAQAEAIGAALRSQRLAGVYSSPLLRARQTAEAIARAQGLSVQVVEQLREMNVGELDGLSFTDMGAKYPELMKRWKEDAGAVRLPGGETLAEVQKRTWKAIEDIVSENQGKTAAIVSHAFAIQVIVCKALELPLSNFRRIRHDIGAITTIEFQGGISILKGLNDSCHLSTPEGRWLQL